MINEHIYIIQTPAQRRRRLRDNGYGAGDLYIQSIQMQKYVCMHVHSFRSQQFPVTLDRRRRPPDLRERTRERVGVPIEHRSAGCRLKCTHTHTSSSIPSPPAPNQVLYVWPVAAAAASAQAI